MIMPAIIPPNVSPSRDIQVVRAMLDLLERRFEADAQCHCRFFSCPQCDVNDLYKATTKLHAFISDE